MFKVDSTDNKYSSLTNDGKLQLADTIEIIKKKELIDYLSSSDSHGDNATAINQAY